MLERVLKRFRFYTRPNLQCSVGASIGLFSIMCTWIVIKYPDWFLIPLGVPLQPFHIHPARNLIEILILADPTTQFFCMLFVMGTALALISPLGGIPQSIGLLGFVLSYHYYVAGYEWAAWIGTFPHSSLGLGYYLGLASMVIVITSAGGAIRSANNGRPVRALSRFAAMSPSSLR
jgi:hypothetical protein